MSTILKEIEHRDGGSERLANVLLELVKERITLVDLCCASSARRKELNEISITEEILVCGHDCKVDWECPAFMLAVLEAKPAAWEVYIPGEFDTPEFAQFRYLEENPAFLLTEAGLYQCSACMSWRVDAQNLQTSRSDEAFKVKKICVDCVTKGR